MTTGQIHFIGTSLLIGGGVLMIAEASAGADANVTGVPFCQTAVGGIVQPIEKYLPFSLGFTLLIIGGIVLFVPFFRGKK